MKIPALFALLTLAVSSTFAADPVPASAVPAGELPVADHLVYLSELPASADLMKDASANGLTVKRLDRTSDRVVVTYSYPDGSISTMGYALLSSAGNADYVTPRSSRVDRGVETREVRVVSPEPEIIYYEPRYRQTRYVYRDPIDNFWLPLTLGLGIGWVSGHNGHHGSYYGHGYSGRRH